MNRPYQDELGGRVQHIPQHSEDIVVDWHVGNANLCHSIQEIAGCQSLWISTNLKTTS